MIQQTIKKVCILMKNEQEEKVLAARHCTLMYSAKEMQPVCGQL